MFIKNKKFKDIIGMLPLLFFSFFVLTGVNYCQKDFVIGAQSGTPTPTPTPTLTPTDDTELAPSETPTPTPTPTATLTPTPTTEVKASVANILKSLALDLAKGNSREFNLNKERTNKATRIEYEAMPVGESWLLQLADRKDNIVYLNPKDSDNDGFADWLEDTLGDSTWKFSASFYPQVDDSLKGKVEINNPYQEIVVTSYSEGEIIAIADIKFKDSGKERFFQALADREFEQEQLKDSDGDFLSDQLEELVLSTDPFIKDTDGDGVIDSKEVLLGLNPLILDSNANGVLDKVALENN